MRSSFISAAVLALASSVFAQTANFDAITSPTQDQNIPAGSSFDIIWQPGSVADTITITLLQGATASTLQPGPVVASNVTNSAGKFTWAVPSTSSFATYGFMISDDKTPSTFQYSFPFHITGGSSSSATGSATGTPSTVTLHVSTNTAYTPTSSPTSTTTVVSTSTSSSASKSSPAPTSTVVKPSSNTTLSNTLTTVSSTKTSTSSSSTSSAPSTQSTNAAVSNIATGGLAMIGGLFLAFAL